MHMTFKEIQDKYWRALILQNAEARGYKRPDEKTLQHMVSAIENDDAVWNEIDSSINYFLEDYCEKEAR